MEDLPVGSTLVPDEPLSPEAWVAVNGEPKLLAPETTLLEILRNLGITPETPAVAIAVNERVVRRHEWAAHRLAPGDRIEVVRAMQGG